MMKVLRKDQSRKEQLQLICMDCNWGRKQHRGENYSRI